jgi:Putative beta-lactamase-inhibitor-like, PepSY-like
VEEGMKISTTFTVLAYVGVLSIWGASTSLAVEKAADQEQAIECDGVPAAVRTAFQKAYPKATIQGCAKEVEDDKTAYEISSTEGKTRRDILYYEDGSVAVAEEAIDTTDLPKPVQQALTEALADQKIELVERLTRNGAVTYEIQSTQADVGLEVVFDSSGKVLKIAAASLKEGEEKTEAREEEDENEEEEKGGK